MSDVAAHARKAPPRKRALVIAGAGAALAFGAPSTSKLTELVRGKISTDDVMRHFGADQACRRIDETLSAYLVGGSDAVNFEHIFHCAQELLSNTFKPTPGAVNEFRPILYPFVGRWVALDEETALTELVRRIPELLFSELSAASDNPRMSLAPLADFLDRLRKTYVTRVYTTNYDDFIQQAAPDLYHGFDSTPGGGPRSFEPEAFWASADKDSVFHLHGSVHFGFPPRGHASDDLNVLRWFHDRAEARLHASFTGSAERKMDGSLYLPSALITGFDKLARMQQTPQAHYYASLARDAMTADLIVLVGFSLVDLHINARIAEARRRRPSPPLVFVDLWKGSFLCDTHWDMNQKEIEMLHALRMFIIGDYYRDNVVSIGPGWTVAKDGSCAVWDRGFFAFLDALDQLLNVLKLLKPV